ncbi:MAG TPA: VWA domain-containing protein, partial [Treponemataceae bacterium]|nr:VWA domain-containing protein [Treponemataceae bacterium]
DGTIILELTVEGQTKKIGSRNIHALSAGARKSIGGGLSVFSIFFIKVPANIAEIRYDGQSCSLALLKPKYFPEADSNIIEDCLNKAITVISEHGYITRIMFSEYESQTEKLNELLLSVIPEEDKKKYIKK